MERSEDMFKLPDVKVYRSCKSPLEVGYKVEFNGVVVDKVFNGKTEDTLIDIESSDMSEERRANWRKRIQKLMIQWIDDELAGHDYFKWLRTQKALLQNELNTNR